MIKKFLVEFNIIKNQKGTTLIELLIVLGIIGFLAAMIGAVTVRSVKLMSTGMRQTVAQSSADQVVNQIAEDVRQAGANNLAHILDSSDSSNLYFVRFMKNYDAYAPASTDMNFDIACYTFHPPSGANPYDPAYIPGYIEAGTASGGGAGCGSAHMYPITDSYTDIRDFKVQYCSPNNTVAGKFNCTNSIDNTGITAAPPSYPGTADCVWLVKINVVYARRLETKGATADPNYVAKAVNTFQTAVKLRNPYLMSLFQDQDDDTVIDCCDPDNTTDNRYDKIWCPSVQK